MLTSAQGLEVCEGATNTIVVVSQETIDLIPTVPLSHTSHPELTAGNAAYVIYTSGSTGGKPLYFSRSLLSTRE